MSYETIVLEKHGSIATITLNRPEQMNTIVPPMPWEISDAVKDCTFDQNVKVIILRGAGRAFCAGYNFGGGFHHWDQYMTTNGRWDPGKDFAMATTKSMAPTQQLWSIWETSKPVIAQIHGYCVGGGSDFALGADLIVASDDARIGTPYARMWGAYLSGMWIYRLGLAKAKWHGLTGIPLSGKEAAECGLINQSVPFDKLEQTVWALANQLCNIPTSQLAAQKLVINHAYENMGISSTQTLGPILDGLMRNTPDALDWINKANAQGVKAAVTERDGPWEDYSQGNQHNRPNPNNIINVKPKPRL
eukprot:Clim_evm2s238 gene=Clim_evmTU2s238